MNNMYRIGLLALSAGVFFLATSCDPAKKYSAEISTIDSCLTELNELDVLYQGIEFDSLKQMVLHVKSNEKKMKTYYSSDTINADLGSHMNICKGIRKSLKGIESARVEFVSEITALKTQFENLKTDILNNVLNKEQIDDYLATEKDALEKFSLSFMAFYENQKLQSEYYYTSVPFVDQYVATLNIPDEDTIE